MCGAKAMNSPERISICAAAIAVIAACAGAPKPAPGNPNTATPVAAASAAPAGGAPASTAIAGGPIGWAAVEAMDVKGTTGGGDLPVEEVTDDGQLWDLARSDQPHVIRIMRSTTGSLDIASNKT